MFSKSIIVNIFCKSKPCELTILAEDGHIIQKATIGTTKMKFVICTNDCIIKVIATHNDLTYYKTIFLGNCKCQSIFVSFGFNTTISQKLHSVVVLSDANYGFPVARALLNFKQQSNS